MLFDSTISLPVPATDQNNATETNSLQACSWEPEQDTATVEVPADWFSTAVTKILAAVIDRAAGNSTSTATNKYFATGEEDFDPKIYGLAQCLPIMTPAQCRGCLGILLGIVATQYSGARRRWVRVVSDWCSLMYSARPFYEGGAMLQVSAPPAPPSVTPKAGAGTSRLGSRHTSRSPNIFRFPNPTFFT